MDAIIDEDWSRCDGWYVAFVGDRGRNLWDIFTTKEFRHCYAFRWDGYNWIVVDALSNITEICILPFGEDVDLPAKIVEDGQKVVYFSRQRQDKFIFRGLLTCVSMVKHLLGIRAWWVVTPKQLYNYIRSNT